MTEPSLPNDDLPEPPQLKFLRILVTVLTATMIAGMVIIIALMWTRFNAPRAVPGALTLEKIVLPSDEVASAVTQGEGWIAVVTKSQKILIYNAATGDLTQTVPITLE